MVSNPLETTVGFNLHRLCSNMLSCCGGHWGISVHRTLFPCLRFSFRAPLLLQYIWGEQNGTGLLSISRSHRWWLLCQRSLPLRASLYSPDNWGGRRYCCIPFLFAAIDMPMKIRDKGRWRRDEGNPMRKTQELHRSIWLERDFNIGVQRLLCFSFVTTTDWSGSMGKKYSPASI